MLCKITRARQHMQAHGSFYTTDIKINEFVKENWKFKLL